MRTHNISIALQQFINDIRFSVYFTLVRRKENIESASELDAFQNKWQLSSDVGEKALMQCHKTFYLRTEHEIKMLHIQ